MFDQVGQGLGAGALGFRYQRHSGPPPGGIAHRGDLLQGDPGQQPYIPGALFADIVAESAGQQHLVEVGFREARILQQNLQPGVDGSLGQLQFAQVGLGKDDILTPGCNLFSGQDKFKAAFSAAQPRFQLRRQLCSRCFRIGQAAGRFKHVRFQQCRSGVDEP